MRIVSIVEGKGEEEAVPILLRRIAERVIPGVSVDVRRPIRVKRQQIVKAGELERAVEFAARRAGVNDGILILLDADTDCPADLAPNLLRRATAAREDRAIRLVLAKMEYEAWFLAGAASVAGQHRIDSAAVPQQDAEAIRNAKGWLSKQMPPGQPYRPTLHQPSLTAIFDLDAARAAPSFDKLWRDVTSLLKPARR